MYLYCIFVSFSMRTFCQYHVVQKPREFVLFVLHSSCSFGVYTIVTVNNADNRRALCYHKSRGSRWNDATCRHIHPSAVVFLQLQTAPNPQPFHTVVLSLLSTRFSALTPGQTLACSGSKSQFLHYRVVLGQYRSSHFVLIVSFQTLPFSTSRRCLCLCCYVHEQQNPILFQFISVV